jgi:hypothetical protein
MRFSGFIIFCSLAQKLVSLSCAQYVPRVQKLLICQGLSFRLNVYVYAFWRGAREQKAENHKYLPNGIYITCLHCHQSRILVPSKRYFPVLIHCSLWLDILKFWNVLLLHDGTDNFKTKFIPHFQHSLLYNDSKAITKTS